MPLDRIQRILHHRKAPKTSSGVGPPNPNEGNNGDISFRSVKDSGTVQYLKKNGQWIPVSASGTMPPVRIIKSGGGGTSSSSTGNSISSHDELVGLANDDHAQYVHISTARTISANHAFTGTPTFTTIDINGGTIDGTAISADSTQTEWDAAYTHSQVAGGDSVHVSTAENTQWDTAYTHSQIAGGDSVHVSTTENTQWDAAYTHSLDNSQAHSDYLINNGNDVTSGTLQINGTLDLATGSITDSSGSIDFGDENLSTDGNVDIDGNLDVDGTSNLDIVDIDGAVDMASTLTLAGDADFNGDLDVDGVTNLDIVDVDGAVDMASTLTVAGVVDITNTTDSSDDSGDTGALRVEGGVSIAKKLYVGTDLDVDGVSNLDAVDIDGNVQVDNQTTTVESSGAISITSQASVTINSKTDFYLNVDGRSSIRANTTSDIFFNTYSTTLNNNNYGLNNKASLYHFTTGGTDFRENYSILAGYEELAGTTEHETYPS